MLTLKSLEFVNIGPFIEPQVIDFTKLGNLVQVDAQNLNTGGSSGGGKSTIFKALEFLLGLNDISNGILQSRLTKSPMSVSGVFDFNGRPLKITRDKKLLIDLDGEITTGSSKIAEEKLDQVIGIDRELFRKMLIKRQGEQGFFLNLGPSETHKFLTNALGLQAEQAKVLVLDARLDTLYKSEIVATQAHQGHSSALQAVQASILSIGSPPVQEFSDDAIQALESQYEKLMQVHSLLKQDHREKQDLLEKTRPVVTMIPFDRSLIEDLEGQVSVILFSVSELEKIEGLRQGEVSKQIHVLETKAVLLNNAELTRQSDVKSGISGLQIAISNLNKAEQVRQAEVNSRIHLNQLSTLTNQTTVSDGGRAKEAAIRLAKELQVVRTSMCPTCNQEWITDAAKAKEADIVNKLGELKILVVAGTQSGLILKTLKEEILVLNEEANPRSLSDVEALNFQIEALKKESSPKVVPEIQPVLVLIQQLRSELTPKDVPEAIELRTQKSSLDPQLALARQHERDHQYRESDRQQLLISNFTKTQKELRSVHESEICVAFDQENQAQKNLYAAKNRVQSFEEARLRFEAQHASLSRQIQNHQVLATQKKVELDEITEEIDLASESKKLIKSYLSCSFDDALDSIGDAATRFIRNIPNMSSATIRFEGLKETKEGKVKEEVTSSISMNGEIGIPIKSLSGGERSSTDLAIDLAVMEFIQERSGIGANLLILDEPFQGLDEANISSIMEFLKESGTNKQILIVDHNPVAKESFESKITVIRDGLTSKVVV